MTAARTIAVALGSNLGDRAAHLAHAVSRLHSFIDHLQVSAWLETDPVGVAGQSRYLNGAAVGTTTLEPREALDQLLIIEKERGRTRPYVWAPRTLDLDLILLGDAMVDEPGLEVPHPRFRDRFFVLEPLVSIAPELVDPVTGLTMAALLRQLQGPEG